MKKSFALFFLCFAGIASAPATTLLPMGLDDLTASSQTVVYARILASRSEWNEDRTLIFTVYTVEPIEYLKGRLGPIFELREPGGELDGLVLSVPSVPAFSAGDEAVLFVWTDLQGRHQVTGFERGAIAVQREPQTGLKMAARSIGLGTARQKDPAVLLGLGTSRFLPQLFDQIRISVARTRPVGAVE